MRLQFIRRTHYQILFLSYPKIGSKVRFMYATLNVAASHGAKYNQTFPVGQHNHNTTLRLESNQGRRRPTSWSFFQNSPTPVSMRSPCHEVELFLFLRLKPRFPRFSPTLLFKSPFLFFVSPPLPPSHCLVYDGSRACPLSCHMSTFQWLLRFPLSSHPSTMDFLLMT